MKKLIIVLCLFLAGCALNPIVVQEKDKIFTLKAGTPIKVSYDNKIEEKIFQEDRFVISKDALIGDARQAIDKELNKVKQGAIMKRNLAILGSILGIIAMALAIYVKTKGIKIKFNAENK